MKLAKRYVASVLRQAAKIIETNGWRQGSVGIPRGPRCMAGAVNEVVGGPFIRSYNEKYKAILSAVSKRLPAPPRNAGYVGWWNDTPGRTKEEVCKKLRQVARELEHGGEL